MKTKSKSKRKAPAVKVLLLARPRKTPDFWPRDHRGRPTWATVSSSRAGDVDGYSSGIDLDRVIDARFVDELIRSWEDTYGKGFMVRVVTVQAL